MVARREHAATCNGYVSQVCDYVDWIECPICLGSGFIKGTDFTDCERCAGEGYIADSEPDWGDCNGPEDYHDLEAAQHAIEESPLSIQVRSGWYTPGDDLDDAWPAEFEILLTTGGPALRICGDLNGPWASPTRAYMQYQDWGTPWIDYYEPGIGDLLLKFVQDFYFGG